MSPSITPFRDMPPDMLAAEQSRLRQQYRTTPTDSVARQLEQILEIQRQRGDAPPRRMTWRMVRFTNIHDGPAYIDLAQVAAVNDVELPYQSVQGELPVARGAAVFLNSGAAIMVKQTADAVFEEVRRYRTQEEPQPDSMKYGSGESAPPNPPAKSPAVEAT